MRVAKKALWMGMLAGRLLNPTSSCGDFPGGIVVFAWDSSSLSNAPPETTATLDSDEVRSFTDSDFVLFSEDVETGLHLIEVSTRTEGYVPRASPTDPDAIHDPYSAYGNPRYVEITGDTDYVPVNFQFDPTLTVTAVIRDAWTMERLADAEIAFVYDGASERITVDQYPWFASYAAPWSSDSNGHFPTNTILYLHNYDLSIIRDGYQSYFEADVITNAVAGDTIDLGTVYLEPVDQNHNQIADLWESRYFGPGSDISAEEDDDGDRMSNRNEYIAGTDPANPFNSFWVTSTADRNQFSLAWYVQPDRTYRVCGTTNLLCPDTWVQVGGPWEAANGQTEMVWTDENTDLSWNSSYRVEIIPNDWQEPNQILINTNRPIQAVAEGDPADWTGIPPIPGAY